MPPDISVSIINTNNCAVTLNGLRALYAAADGLDLEVFVVNNACQDGSREAIAAGFPQVRQLENERMLGFSTNNNLVFGQASGRYLMLLNDDTLVQPGALRALFAFAEAHPEAGVVGAELLNPDGSPQKCYDYAPNPFYDGCQPLSERLFPLPRSHGQPLNVANVDGACMMVRAGAARQVGLLDTRFDPLYSEEVDWCFRFKKAGWQIYHIPGARVVHLGGSTMNRAPLKRYERIFEKKALFFRKHYGRPTLAAYKISLFATNLFKSAVWAGFAALGRPHARAELATHWNMARRALFL